MHCVWMLASCHNNGSGGHGRVAVAYTGSECVFLPVSLENLCLYRGGIQEKDCLSGMLIWKTAFLATPGLSHICCICCHFTLSLCLLYAGKELRIFFDGPPFTSAVVLLTESPQDLRLRRALMPVDTGLTLINLIYRRPQSEPDCFSHLICRVPRPAMPSCLDLFNFSHRAILCMLPS